MKKLVGAFLLAAVLILQSFGVPAYASADTSAAEQPDYSRKGSISVDLKTTDNKPVSGGSLSAYLVARAQSEDANHTFVTQDPFTGAGEVLDEEALSEENVLDLAEEFAGKIGEAKSVQTKAVDVSGHAEFSDLELGVYLIVQESPAEGFEPIEPFLVTVPLRNGTALNYKVDATPKVSAAYERAVYTPDVEKKITVKNGTLSAKDVFVFRITPALLSAPMPENATATIDKTTGAMTVSRSGEGTVSFGEITYGLDDVDKTYNYTIEEVAGTDSHYEYDSRKYTMSVKVAMTDNRISVSVSYIDTDNKSFDKATFTNTYNEVPPTTIVPKTPGGKLPQTGALWWPAIITFVAGIFLFVLGFGLRRRYSRVR